MRFVKTGDPNVPGQEPAWPQVPADVADGKEPFRLWGGTATAGVGYDADCAFFDDLWTRLGAAP